MTEEARQPSWKRFADHEGPTEDQRTKALRDHRIARGGFGGQFGDDLHQGTPRKTKFGRATRINGIPLK